MDGPIPISNLHIGIACYIGTIGATAMTGPKPQSVGDPNDRQGDRIVSSNLEQSDGDDRNLENTWE